MLITPISQTNYSFKKEDSRSVQTKQNKNKTDRVLLYSLMGFSALMAISMLDRTSKTRLQKLFAEEVECKNKTREINLHKPVEMEIKSFKDDTTVESIDNLVGLNKIKDFVNKYQTLLSNKKTAREHNIEPVSSILFWGVPGTGKTTAAKGIAKKLDADFIQIDKELFDSEFVSVSARQLTTLVDQIEQHAKNNPNKQIVVFMDEIDGTMSIDKGNNSKHSEDLVNTLKKAMTHLQQECENVIFIGATNKDPNGLKSDNTAVRLNTAILSRFNYQFELDLPQPKYIKEAWEKLIKTQSGKVKFTDRQNEIISQKFHELGMSYRDIKNISNKMNIEDAVEFCKNGSYNSKKNLIKVLREDEKIGYNSVKKQSMEQKKKECIIKELEESLSKQN